jgi:hypothetical protein
VTVASAVSDLDGPIEIAGRTFTVGCRLRIAQLTALGTGVELAPLIPLLRTFPDPANWSARMRQPLLRLANEDVHVIAEAPARCIKPKSVLRPEPAVDQPVRPTHFVLRDRV